MEYQSIRVHPDQHRRMRILQSTMAQADMEGGETLIAALSWALDAAEAKLKTVLAKTREESPI